MEFRKNFNLERQQHQQMHRQQLEQKLLQEQEMLTQQRLKEEEQRQQDEKIQQQLQKTQQEYQQQQQKYTQQLKQQLAEQKMAEELHGNMDIMSFSETNNGFLGSFLNKGLKTNQLVVNTDEKTLRPIARLKEPRDLFALPKDKDNDCSQQAPRWPIECQVLNERMVHIPNTPSETEPFHETTGDELKPRPVGEENGIIVFNYNPISAVNYKNSKSKYHDDDSSDSDSDSTDSRASTPERHTSPLPKKLKLKYPLSEIVEGCAPDTGSTSNSNDEDEEDEDDENNNDNDNENANIHININEQEQTMLYNEINAALLQHCNDIENDDDEDEEYGRVLKASEIAAVDLGDVWKDKSPEYQPATPTCIKRHFNNDVPLFGFGSCLNRIFGIEPQLKNNLFSTDSDTVSFRSAESFTNFHLPNDNTMDDMENKLDTKIIHLNDNYGKISENFSMFNENKNTVDGHEQDKNDEQHLGNKEVPQEQLQQQEQPKKPLGNSLKSAKARLLQIKKPKATATATKTSNAASGNNATNAKKGDLYVLWSRRKKSTAGGGNNNLENGLVDMEIAGYKNIAHAPVTLSPSQLSRLESVSQAPNSSTQDQSHSNSSNSGSSDSLSDSSDGENEGGIATSSNSLNTQNVWPEHLAEPISKSRMQENTNLNANLIYNYFQANAVENDKEVNVILPPPDKASNINDNELPNLNNANNYPNNDNTNEDNLSLPQFSRSAVGGAKFLSNCHPYDPKQYDGLEFESRFESGNLAKAVLITRTYYELYLRSDLYTNRAKQWFYFRVKRTKKDVVYRFSIVNLVKSDSLYNEGMRPLMYSTIDARKKNVGWRRCGENIAYYRNDDESNGNDDDEDNSSYTLTFNIEFPHDDDTVFFAHSYPYTYSDLQDYLLDIQKHPVKSQFCKLRLLCRTLAGNNVYYLTVTAPSKTEETAKRKKSIVVSARVHPSETPASWMMKGLMDYITGDTVVAKRLRHRFIFKLIPMLNPDGVIVGNTRNSLTGKDLNRQYRTVIRETYPSIWYTKALIKRLIDENGVAMYCDMHAHSRRHNIFIYGCENKRSPEKKLTEQVFPLMLHKNVADKFSFENCKFKIQRSKEGTGRIVVWMLGITNSYTIEASFGGSLLGSRKGTHFTTLERLRLKIIERLLKEGSSADEPLNIPLSDYSSDEGNCSSSSDNEGKESISVSDLEGPCCAPLKAPPCSPQFESEVRRFRFKRMRKIMRKLDHIYFQPLLHKKFQIIFKGKNIKQKAIKLPRKQRKQPAKLSEDTTPAKPNATNSTRSNQINKYTINLQHLNTTNAFYIKTHMQQQQPLTQVPKRLTNQSCSMQNSSSQISCSQSHKQQFCTKSSATATTLWPTISKCSTKTETETSNEVSRDYQKPILKQTKKKRIKLERVLRLWLLERNIVISRRNKRRRRNVRRKTIKPVKKTDRLPLDMPTTDPGSDLHFSTDDEFNFVYGNQTMYGTVPRMRRNELLQSDLQRRYIEEISDGDTVAYKVARMPPELIVTSPGKHKKHASSMPNTAPNKLNVDNTANTTNIIFARYPMQEATGMGDLTKRTNSWHNLNSNTRISSKLKGTTAYPYLNANNDDLQYKLSLKKKIWTGLPNNEATATNASENRPASWYQSMISKNAILTQKNKSSLVDVKRVESNAAFLRACSEKLRLWQQAEELGDNSTKHSKVDAPAETNTAVRAVHERKKHVTMPEYYDCSLEDSTLRIFRHIMKQPCGFGERHKDSQPTASAAPATKQEKSKKRSSLPLSKLTESINLGTRLAKIKQPRSKTASTTRLRKSATSLNAQSIQQKLNANCPNKFKTGGIVVTAVQPTAKKSKKLKAIVTNNKMPLPNTATAGANVNAAPASTNLLLNNKDKTLSSTIPTNNEIKTVANSKTMLRKLKTKIKKKTLALHTQQLATLEDKASNLAPPIGRTPAAPSNLSKNLGAFNSSTSNVPNKSN